MEQYMGTKTVKAKPMNRLEYTNLRGWTLPSDGSDEGYLVEYQDGGKANTKEYKGYISWSPKDMFDMSYNLMNGLTFGDAISSLKLGLKVARKGWNGKGMYLFLICAEANASSIKDFYAGGMPVVGLPSIGMYTVDSTGRKAFLNGWLASQTDMLSEDWMVV
jgi:hypothetical protein